MLGLKTTPVVPVVAIGRKPFPMLDDVLQERWSTQLITYRGLDDLRALLDAKLVSAAEAKVLELQGPKLRDTNPRLTSPIGRYGKSEGEDTCPTRNNSAS
jgi:hypothetical protein